MDLQSKSNSNLKSNFRIRLAQEKDLPEIVELWKEFMDFHSQYDPFFTRAEDGHVHALAYFKKNLADPENYYLIVAEDLSNHSLVGYSMGKIQENPLIFKNRMYGSIFDMAVSSQFRRLGLGKLLFHEMKNWFKSRDITRITLNVLLKNEISPHFWRDLGFKPVMESLFHSIE